MHNLFVVFDKKVDVVFVAVVELALVEEVCYCLLGEVDLVVFGVVLLVLNSALDSSEELVAAFGLKELKLDDTFGQVEPVFADLKFLVLLLGQ